MMDDGSVIGSLILLIVAAMFFSVEPPIYPFSIKHAEEVCESNGGWKKIEEGYGNMSSVQCNNGAEFEYDWAVIKNKEIK